MIKTDKHFITQIPAQLYPIAQRYKLCRLFQKCLHNNYRKLLERIRLESCLLYKKLANSFYQQHHRQQLQA